MEGDERQDSGGAVQRDDREDREQREEQQRNGVERTRRDRDAYERPRGDDRRRRGRVDGEGEWRREGDKRERDRWGQQHRGGSSNRESRERGSRDVSYDSLQSTDRKKKRIEEKEKQASTIFVGDLDPDTTAEQLTGLFKRFGSVLSSKIKENHCYGFVTFDKKEAADAAIAAGQNRDGIELLNGKQVYVSWALGSLPEWKKGIGGFTVPPGKDLLHGHRSRKGVVKPSVLAAATAAAAAKANAVLASMDNAASMEPLNDYRGRAIVAYDDLL